MFLANLLLLNKNMSLVTRSEASGIVEGDFGYVISVEDGDLNNVTQIKKGRTGNTTLKSVSPVASSIIIDQGDWTTLPTCDTVLFSWLHMCVASVLLMVVLGILCISISSSAFVNNKKVQIQAIRFFKFSFICEVVNTVNWDYYMPIFGGLLVSSPITTIVMSVVLFYSIIGVSIIPEYSTRSSSQLLLIFFLTFFLGLVVYSHNLIILFLGIEGMTLALGVAIAIESQKQGPTVIVAPVVSTQEQTSVTVKEEPVVSAKDSIIVAPYQQVIASVNNPTTITNQARISGALTYFIINIFVTIAFGLLLYFCIFFFDTLSYITLYQAFLQLDTNTANGVELVSYLIVTFLFFFIFAFKMGLVPFHFWLPSVFAGFDYSLLFFFSIPVKIVLLVAMHKIFYGVLFAAVDFWQILFLCSGFLSIFVGSIGLFCYKEIKKFLAYSTITHFGYMFIAFGCGSVLGQKAFFIYLLTYIASSIPFFVFIMYLRNVKTGLRISSFTELADIRFNSRTVQIGFAFVLLSMLGLPPLLGFWGKYSVILAVLGLSAQYSSYLILFIIFTSVIAAVSYLGVLKTLFFSSIQNLQLTNIGIFPKSMLVVFYSSLIIICFGATIYFCPFFVSFLDYFILNNSSFVSFRFSFIRNGFPQLVGDTEVSLETFYSERSTFRAPRGSK